MAASTGRITQHLVNRTLHCAHLPRAIHTHNFLVCTWLEMFELSCVLSCLKSHSISSMFRGALLECSFFCSPFSTPFPTLASSPATTPSQLFSWTSSTTAPPQGGLLFGRLAEQSPLTGCEPKSLIEVSSEHTPINLPSRKGSLDTNLDDLATTVDASEMIDTIEVGQLTSPLFSQDREVSATPSSVSGSQAHSSAERPMRDTDLFSSFGRPV